MKGMLIAALLACTIWPAHAQVAPSTDALALPPAMFPDRSGPMAVTFTNQTSESIDVYGLGANGPFDFDWECEGDPGGVTLAPFSTCTLFVWFVPEEGALGVVEGLVGFRLSTGTIITPLTAFAYTDERQPGVQNLVDSWEALGFATDTRLFASLEAIQAVLLDSQPRNDAGACGRLRQVAVGAEHEAASGAVSEWGAVAVAMQAEAVFAGPGCPGGG